MKTVLAVAVASLFMFAPVASADHVQQEEGRSISFDHKTGNEWWVEVILGGADASSVSSVHAKDEGGSWVALEKKDWGAWGASFHIEAGNDVRFRATWGDDRVRSCWFSHPDGVEACETQEPGDPDGFDASFRTPGGNEWWVEVYVEADRSLAAVHARAGGGTWVALEEKDWGAWAKSFHVEDGSLVQFRATSTAGDRDLSGEYRWPEGTNVSGSDDPPTTTDVAFGPKAGNPWWVEAIVVGDGEPIEGVEARPEGGSWHELRYRDWGAWAASFHVPAGSDVEFRATTPSGTDTSVLFSWPDARPAGSDGSWPEEGSYARYNDYRQGAPGIEDDTKVNHVHHAGAWWYHRVGTHEDPGGAQPIEEWGRRGPSMMPTDVQVGDTFQHGNREVTVLEEHQHEVRQDGDRVEVRTWYGENHTHWDYAQYDWDQATGLQMFFHDGGTSWMTRELLDTDAPMRKV